ncbi:MAG TPA: GNAT family N-acetyltransferase [Nocardioidaceae bacterium]|nr:GNAT family N-acetyltransferase [Nocardioidaceae bacterium]
MTSGHDLIARIEASYDGSPRPRADTEEVGPFTLFVARADMKHGYYARPSLGGTLIPTVDDARRLLALQRERDLPRAIEWVDEVTPGLDRAAEEAGYAVERYPLMALDGELAGNAGSTRLIDPADEALLVETRAAIAVAFDNEGTTIGEAGLAERDAAHDSPHAVLNDSFREAVAAGDFILAAAFAPDEPAAGAVGGGSLMPVGDTAEIAGVGVLPAYRRRGLAAEITYVLGHEGRRRGVDLVFCSADSDDVARVYAGVGFRRVGTALIAEAPAS